MPVHLGLDLRGGTQIVLETRPTDDADAGGGATDRTVEVLRGRIDALGVTEPTIARSGSDRIVVELPGLQDPRKAADVLGRTARLSFHQVLGPATDVGERRDPLPERPRESVIADETGRLRLKTASLTGKDVKKAVAGFDGQGGAGWHVNVDFRKTGETGWARLTGDAACHQAGDPRRRVAIVLDDKITSSPQVAPSVACRSGIGGGSTQIAGTFDDSEAKELALLINGGALPVPVETVEQRTVGPTLGAHAITASAWAAAIGTAMTSLFIIAVYRIMGVLATVALACYGLISYAALVALGATPTLPGLAGFVLAALLTVIGYSVNDCVVVFDRIRELGRRDRKEDFALIAGQAFLGTLPRTVNTGMGAASILTALTVLGGDTLTDFALALLIGLTVGTCSSMFTATPLAIELHRRA
ncbi:protein translocase subunit SecD [Streptomyces sp.]|uniref:protein translocase subunit SecD n=1 Tax=Streptomyces sp. TaxID=1931 RepID=UPI0025D819B3|nr:protein translocase subunit SecD [Streptomyces sp.]